MLKDDEKEIKIYSFEIWSSDVMWGFEHNNTFRSPDLDLVDPRALVYLFMSL